MRKKNITLNGKKCDGSERVEEGDEISLFMADETIEKFSAPLPQLEALGKEHAGNLEKSGKAGMKQHNTGQEAANAISNFGTNSATSPAQSKAMADLINDQAGWAN